MQDILELYDLTFQRIGILTNNTRFSVRNIVNKLKINSVGTLNFDIPIQHPLFNEIIPENIVKYRDEYYFISKPSKQDGENGRLVSVECRHFVDSLNNVLIDKCDIVAITVTECLKYLLEGVLPASATSDTMVTKPTGWVVGTIDLKNIVMPKRRSLQTSSQSIFANLTKVAELFDGRLSFNSLTKSVDFTDKPINRNIVIRKGLNLKDVSVEYDTSEMVTKLYPRGGQDVDTKRDILILGAKDENGNTVTNNYVENYTYFTNQKNSDGTRKYSDEYIKNNPLLFVREAVWNGKEYGDSQSLYDDAIEKLKKICVPKLNCTFSALDLSGIPEYFVASPKIGETVKVVDDDLNICVEAYVTEIGRKSDAPLDIDLTISNIIDYSNILKELTETSDMVNFSTNALGYTKGSYIGGVIDLLRASLEGSMSRVTTDKNGCLLIEDKSGVMAVKIGGGIIGVANSKIKDSEGNDTADYSWTTFATGEGLVANAIVTGLLKGGNVQWNLETGAFIIGKSTTDYDLYYDGATLHFGNNVKIAWDNVTGTDTVLKKDINGDDYITSITNTTITTAKIRANQLLMGGENGTISWENVTDANGETVKYKFDNIDFSALDLSNYATKDDLTSSLVPMLTKNNFNTVLGSDFIITSKISANNILAGAMTGVTLKTIPDTDSTTPTYISLQEQNIMFNAKGADGGYHQQFKISCNPSDVGWSEGVDPNAPQLFFNQYCSIDTSGNKARFRRDRNNYVCVDDQELSFYSRDTTTGTSRQIFVVNEGGITYKGSPLGSGGTAKFG